MSGLEELIARVEKATGPDRGLDGRIALFLGWAAHFDLDPKSNYFDYWSDYGGHWLAPGHWSGSDPFKCLCRSDVLFTEPPPYTASLDAVIGLVERELPGANCWGVDKDPNECSGFVSRNNVDSGHWMTEAFHKTPALALLLAFLRAKAEQP